MNNALQNLKLVGILTVIWMFILIIALYIIYKINNITDPFYNVGPNENLFLLGINIDTYTKYMSVLVYFCFNTGIRSLNYNITYPWIIQNIQNDNIFVQEVKMAYVIKILYVLYTWFDIFMYINIFLSQIDLMFLEIIADVFASILTTKYHFITKQRLLPI